MQLIGITALLGAHLFVSSFADRTRRHATTHARAKVSRKILRANLASLPMILHEPDSDFTGYLLLGIELIFNLFWEEKSALNAIKQTQAKR